MCPHRGHMGFWSSVVRGRPDPLVRMAVDAGNGFSISDSDQIVGGVQIDPAVFGLTTYISPSAPTPRVSRREAMQVPAVKRSRDLIAGSLGTLPMETIKPDRTVDNVSWLNQPERDVPRSVTMTNLVEDLLFEGIAWWKITAFDWRGFPAEVVRLEPRSVDVLADGRVQVTSDGHSGISPEWPKDSELIRFDSASDPLLVAGARAIRACLALDAAALRHADGAPPLDYFTPADDAVDPEDDDVIGILDAWQVARQTRSTGYVSKALKYQVAGWNPEQLQMADARQHAVLEIARVAGVDAEELGVSTTSRTYFNAFDRKQNFLNFTQGLYRAAIEDRLSMGDVTPRGTLVRFDLDGFLRSDPLSRYQAAQAGLTAGALTPEEIREDEGRPALPSPAAQTTQEIPA